MRKIGGVNMNTIAHFKGKLTNEKPVERYCSVCESLEKCSEGDILFEGKSLKEMKLIRSGKIKAKTWEEFKKELDNEEE